MIVRQMRIMDRLHLLEDRLVRLSTALDPEQSVGSRQMCQVGLRRPMQLGNQRQVGVCLALSS
jgi:hypothetical protein